MSQIEGSIENKSCSAIQIDTKNVFELFINPQISPLGPQMAKKDPQIRQKLMSELKGA